MAYSDKKYLNNRVKLSEFYKYLTIKKEYDEVNKFYFVKLLDKVAGQVDKRLFKSIILIDNDSDFVVSTPPPTKRARAESKNDSLF